MNLYWCCWCRKYVAVLAWSAVTTNRQVHMCVECKQFIDTNVRSPK